MGVFTILLVSNSYLHWFFVSEDDHINFLHWVALPPKAVVFD